MRRNKVKGQNELLFSKEHEWTTGTDGEVTIGISSYAIEQLGDVVYIELPDQGDEFESGETFGAIESTKTVSDLYMPVSGEIVAVNKDIQSDPGSLVDDPYIDGWLIKVIVNGKCEDLMSAEDYDKFTKDS